MKFTPRQLTSYYEALALAKRATDCVRKARPDIHIWSPPQGYMTGSPPIGFQEVWDFGHKKWWEWIRPKKLGGGWSLMEPSGRDYGNLDISIGSDLFTPNEILVLALEWAKQYFPEGPCWWCTHNGGFEAIPAPEREKEDEGKFALLLDARFYTGPIRRLDETDTE